MPTSSLLSRSQLDQLARLGAQARLAEIQAEVIALESILGGSTPSEAPVPHRRRRGKLSAAGRAAIAAAQRKRWAKTKSKAGRKRSTMSAAARKAVSLRMTKYWAARRKAKAKAA